MSNRFSAYMEQEILSANSTQLVHLLYQAAITELRDARRNLASKQIPAKCANISKACQIIGELVSALNFEAGGEIAVRLDALYRYMLSRLLEANLRNLDEPIAEVTALLSTLGEAWKELAAEPPTQKLNGAMTPFAGQFGTDALDRPAQVWSL